MVESLPSHSDGRVDIFGTGYLRVADGLFGVWRDDRERLRVGGLAPVPSDEHFVIGAVILCHRATTSRAVISLFLLT